MMSIWTLDSLAFDDALSFLLGCGLKGGLFLLSAWVLSWLLRRSSASARHFVWLLALCGMTALPILTLILPEIPIPAPVWGAEALEGMRSPPAVQPGPLDPSQPVQGELASRSVEAGESLPSSAPAASWGAWEWATAAYAAVAFLLLAYWTTGLARAWWMSFRARPLADALWTRDVQALGRRLGLKREVCLKTVAGISAPAVWGARRTVILLPETAPAWSPSDRRSALIHELSHIQRSDWATLVAARLLCAVYWFQPLCWIATARLFLEAERACDDRVVLEGGKPSAYARLLLELAAASQASSVQWIAAPAMAHRNQISGRILSILDPNLRRTSMKTSFIALSILATLFALPLVAAGTLAPAPVAMTSPPQLEPEMTPLMLAARRGDLRTALLLLDRGAEVDESDRGSASPLILAASEGHLDLVRLLLDRGADPNGIRFARHRDRSEELPRTPLLAAVRSGRLDLVRLLLDRGAKVDLAPHGHGTPLMDAARFGDLPILRELLDRGADPDRRIRGDGSPLIQAAAAGLVEGVRWLLEAGADVKGAVQGDGNPLIAASRNGHQEVARILLDAGARAEDSAAGDGNALIQAVQSGGIGLVRDMISRGADLNAVVPGDGTALIGAAQNGDLEMVRALVEGGAYPNLGVPGDGNPLLIAARSGHYEVVDYLLDIGADPNTSVEGDGNALIQACSRGDLEMARRLLEAGADVNAAVKGDENPLVNAASSGNLELVRYLIDLGADVNRSFRGRDGFRTALSMARDRGHDEVVNTLRVAGAVR